MRKEEAEIAITTGFLRRSLSVVGVKGQAATLLGRLEVLGKGGADAARRRSSALHLERMWGNQRRADALCLAQGRALCRRGHILL